MSRGDPGTWRGGTILAILIVAGYIGFEATAVRRSQHLFEPLHTFDQYVSARHAVLRCGDPGEEERERFATNLVAVRRRAGADLAEAQPQKSSDEIEQVVAARTREREREVDALVDAKGCADREVWKLLKLHEQRARLRVR